jgi:hypothetical protein
MLTMFILVCACRRVRQWLDQLGPVRMTGERIRDLARHEDSASW